MKRFLLITVLFLCSLAVRSQSKDTSKTTTDQGKLFLATEIEAEFPGGMPGFYSFLSKNLIYPTIAWKNGIQGKVFVHMFIEKDGRITDAKVIRHLSDEIDAEALRVINLSPRWHPAIQNGKYVRIEYTIPITFQIPPGSKPTDSINTPTLPIEIQPEFPGGVELLYKYLAKNLKYPDNAHKKWDKGQGYNFFL